MEATARAEFDYLGAPASAQTALTALLGSVARWFGEHFGHPTTAQRLAWPAIVEGRNLLLCSPTGSGKTLAAFLPIVSEIAREPNVQSIRCVYLAPLKALVEDTCTSLRRCLEGFRSITVAARTGDTSNYEKKNLPRQPPDILATTPETLAILLAQPHARQLFGGVRWVVVDEVHALAANKRGADLALGLERLQRLTSENVQRIGLSATCAPLADAAGFLVGAGRPCSIARVVETAPLELVVEPLEETGGFLATLVERLAPELHANQSTLIFANTRGLAERICWALRRRFPEWKDQLGVHHSAIDAGRRRDVEKRLKAGHVRAVATSTSLELGIDIGWVDLVVLVHPPGGAVRMLQRVGRSGHGPARARRGLVLTASPAELLEAAVTGAASRSAQWEPLRIPKNPLDVLCQHLVGMALRDWWAPADAYELVRRAYMFGELSRKDFDDCLDYLSGRSADGVTWLPPRLRWREGRFTIVDERTGKLLARNLGTILSEETRSVQLLEPAQQRCQEPISAKCALEAFNEPAGQQRLVTPFRVGQVDEAFADRLLPGDRFLLDGRCLEYRRVEEGSLLVAEMPGRPRVPRWASEGWALSAELAERLFLLRIRSAEALRDGRACLMGLLGQEYGLGERAAGALTAYFQRQECASEIPDAETCLVEAVQHDYASEYYVHTPLPRAANDALARVVVRRLQSLGRCVQGSIVADLGFMIVVQGGPEIDPSAWRSICSSFSFDDDLNRTLSQSLTLRERFRRVALTGLMLLRNPLGGQRSVGGVNWAERRLFGQLVVRDADFPLIRQALKEVRDEACDVNAARTYVEALPHLTIRFRALPRVSPFAEHWTQVDAIPLEPVETPADALRRLHAALFPPRPGAAV